jgi:hypothetical protein
LSKFTFNPVESAKEDRISFKLLSSLISPFIKIRVSSAYCKIGNSASLNSHRQAELIIVLCTVQDCLKEISS